MNTEDKINKLYRHTTKEPSTNTYLSSESYESSFSMCEIMRKSSPITFDEKYKKKFKVK